MGPPHFKVSGVEAEVVFHRNEDGTVGTLTLYQNGVQNATRLPEEDDAEDARPADLAEYEGRYYSNEVETFYTVSVEDETLTVKHRRLDDFTLEPGRADTFSGGGFTFHFERDRNNQVTGFYLSNVRIRDVRFARVR